MIKLSWETPWGRARRAREAERESIAREARTADREAYLAALLALRDLGESQSQAFGSIAKAIEAYMQLWQLGANAQVQGRVISDYDEWAEEQRKLKEAGFPVEAPPADQMAWVLRESAREGSLS